MGVGLALKVQMLDLRKIPMTDKDWKMDLIISEGELIHPIQ
jgi:hypothetical protein